VLVNPGVSLPNAVAPFSPVKVVEASLPQDSVQTLFDPVEKSPETAAKQPRQQTQLEDRFSDRVTLSQQQDNEDASEQASDDAGTAEDGALQAENQSSQDLSQGLTEDQLRQVAELAQRDREVRNHEQAHASVGGAFAGSPAFSFTRGPDGQRYASGGEVSIDVSPVSGDPEATVRKMQVVQRAANAPAEPSGQDRSVAARAGQVELAALAELNEQRANAARVEQEARAQIREEAREARGAKAEAAEKAESDQEAELTAKERFEQISRSTNKLNQALIGSTSINEEITAGSLLDLQV